MSSQVYRTYLKSFIAARRSRWQGFRAASLFVERLEGFDAVEVVLDGGCLAAAVHGEQGVAHVDAAEG